MLILYAPRVHTGGGLVLLKELMQAILEGQGIESVVFLDSRIPEPLLQTFEGGKVNQVLLPSGIRSYWTGERKLVHYAQKNPSATVLCFSNLPPVVRLPNSTVVFVQNRFVVESDSNFSFPWYRKLRLSLERFWFWLFRKNADGYIVQSQSMQSAVHALDQKLKVEVVPFVDEFILNKISQQPAEKQYDFIYVASADPHKNHKNLLKAWRLLAQEGHRPSLLLTLSNSESHRESFSIWQEAVRLNSEFGCHISNAVDGMDRSILFSSARALIFPSTFESYGLPLLEAAAHGLAIIAGELDFVRDSVVPNETFDPRSAVSIARAVKRFMNQSVRPQRPVAAKDFMTQVVLLGKK